MRLPCRVCWYRCPARRSDSCRALWAQPRAQYSCPQSHRLQISTTRPQRWQRGPRSGEPLAGARTGEAGGRGGAGASGELLGKGVLGNAGEAVTLPEEAPALLPASPTPGGPLPRAARCRARRARSASRWSRRPSGLRRWVRWTSRCNCLRRCRRHAGLQVAWPRSQRRHRKNSRWHCRQRRDRSGAACGAPPGHLDGRIPGAQDGEALAAADASGARVDQTRAPILLGTGVGYRSRGSLQAQAPR